MLLGSCWELEEISIVMGSSAFPCARTALQPAGGWAVGWGDFRTSSPVFDPLMRLLWRGGCSAAVSCGLGPTSLQWDLLGSGTLCSVKGWSHPDKPPGAMLDPQQWMTEHSVGVFSGASMGCCVGAEELSTNGMCLPLLTDQGPCAFLKQAVPWQEFALQCPRHSPCRGIQTGSRWIWVAYRPVSYPSMVATCVVWLWGQAGGYPCSESPGSLPKDAHKYWHLSPCLLCRQGSAARASQGCARLTFLRALDTSCSNSCVICVCEHRAELSQCILWETPTFALASVTMHTGKMCKACARWPAKLGQPSWNDPIP